MLPTDGVVVFEPGDLVRLTKTDLWQRNFPGGVLFLVRRWS